MTWPGGIDLAPTTRGGDDAAPVEARQCLSDVKKSLKKKFGKTLLSTALKEAEESKR